MQLEQLLTIETWLKYNSLFDENGMGLAETRGGESTPQPDRVRRSSGRRQLMSNCKTARGSIYHFQACRRVKPEKAEE
jgi:hypothetical protein